MKLLVIEKELRSIEEDTKSALLKEEANVVLELHNNGIIKEIYFSKEHCS
jgi:hypothetical protein